MKTMTSKARAAALACAALLVSYSAANAATVVRVGISQPAYSFAPLDVAMEAGLCKKHDIDIQKTVFQGSSQLHQGISAGSIDIGLGAGPELGFLAKGAPEKAIAAMADAPVDLALVVLKDGPIKTVADLKGKKVSMSTRGSLTEWAARELSRQQGWGNDGLEMVPLGSFSAQTAALKTKQIDGMSVEAGTAGRMEEEGSGRTLVGFAKIVPHFHIHVTYASDAFIAKEPKAISAFMACWLETLDYMDAHKAESVKIAAQSLNMSDALSTKLFDLLMPYYNRTGKFDPKAVDVISQAMVDMGTFKTKLDLTKYINESFLPPAKK